MHMAADRFDACPLNVQVCCALIDIFSTWYFRLQKDHNLQKISARSNFSSIESRPKPAHMVLTMVKADVADFICPGCQARYKMVRAKSAARSHDLPLHCKVCKQPLAATDGENILKYFLIGRPKATRLQARPL
jgi:hypothetical protein